MADNGEIQKIVERAVKQVLTHQLPQLQGDLVQCVVEALPASTGSASQTSSGSDAGNLLQAVATVHTGATQKEILRALLDGGSAYCARIALFVVRGGAATGWQSR